MIRYCFLALLSISELSGLPQPVSLSPMSAIGTTLNYSFNFIPDASTQTPLQTFYGMLDSSLAGKCLFAVIAPSSLYVMNDSGSGWLPVVALGGSQENSYCRISSGSLGATPNVNGGMTLAITVTFKPATPNGNKRVFLAAIDAAGQNSGWMDMNALICVGVCSTSVTPTPTSVSPVNGTSLDQSFSFTYSDADGYADIAAVQVIFGETLSGANTCYFSMHPGSGTVYLVADDGANLAGYGQVGGGGAPLSNTSCTIYPGTASVSYPSATQLRLNIRVVFTPPTVAPQLTIYRGVQDSRGQNSGWVWDGQNVWWYPMSNRSTYSSSDSPSPPAVSIPCKLQVTGPFYSITRVNGNRISLTGRLSLAAPVNSLEVWTAKVRLIVYFKPTGGSKSDISLAAGIPESTTTLNSTTATETLFGVVAGPQLNNTLTLNSRGSGEYSVSMSTSASLSGGGTGCTGPTANLPLINVTTQQPIQLGESAPFPVLRPTIVTTNNAQGIWWFGAVGLNDAPNGYYSSVPIIGNPNWSGTLTYSVTQNPVKVQLSCLNCNNPVAQAVAVSTSGCSQDVTITASADGFMAVAPVMLMVNRPAGRYPQPTYYNNALYSEELQGWGYWSKDFFTFTDLCSMSMSSVAHRESFPGGILPGSASPQWLGVPVASGWDSYRMDNWSTWDDIIMVCTASINCNPVTVAPSSPIYSRVEIGGLLQDSVVAFQQMWWVGSKVSGGFLANQCRQTLYRDHAEDLNYW